MLVPNIGLLIMAAVMAELCPLQIHMLKPESPVPQNVPVFGDRAFKERLS